MSAYITYLIYIVLFEVLIFGGTGYAVFVLEESGWWFVLAVFISCLAYKPSSWFYTTPPQRKTLTGKEIEAIWEVAMFANYGVGAELSNQPFVHFARAIEAKLREKNS